MLGTMASILNSVLEGGLIFVLFMIGLKKTGLVRYRYSLYLGVIGAILSALVIVYGFDFFGDREVFEGYLALGASLVAAAFWFWTRFQLAREQENDYNPGRYGSFLNNLFIGVVSSILILGKSTEAVLFPGTFFIMSSNLLSTELILKTVGVFMGIGIGVLFVFLFLKNEERVSRKMFLYFSGVVLLVVVLRQIITGLQVLFATGVLPLTTWAITIIAPLINNYYPAFFYSLIGFTLILWGITGRHLVKNPPDLIPAHNPAQKRKILSSFNRERRWVRAMGIMLVTIVMILAGNTALANRGINIEPPTPVTAEGDKIYIGLEQVSDGKLHRFSYTTPQNVETRLVVIKKGEILYGTGLDACDICGNAGYYQRGKEVVCKNCDVIINIPTIGFPGGCNPIPLKNRVDAGKLVISTGELESKQDVFKD